MAGNLAEAELIKGVLLEQGIPSLIRRTAGFDVPDFLAAGPRDVLVPESALELAHGLLAELDAEHVSRERSEDEEEPTDPGPELDGRTRRRPIELRVAAAVLAVLLGFGAVAGLILALLR